MREYQRLILIYNEELPKLTLRKLKRQLSVRISRIRRRNTPCSIKLALRYFLKASSAFYYWRFRSTQCNPLTLNTTHQKLQILPPPNSKSNINSTANQINQHSYFKFLNRTQFAFLNQSVLYNNISNTYNSSIMGNSIYEKTMQDYSQSQCISISQQKEEKLTPREIFHTNQGFVNVVALKKVADQVFLKKILCVWRVFTGVQKKVNLKMAKIFRRKRFMLKYFNLLRRFKETKQNRIQAKSMIRKYRKRWVLQKAFKNLERFTMKRKQMAFQINKSFQEKSRINCSSFLTKNTTFYPSLNNSRLIHNQINSKSSYFI